MELSGIYGERSWLQREYIVTDLAVANSPWLVLPANIRPSSYGICQYPPQSLARHFIPNGEVPAYIVRSDLA